MSVDILGVGAGAPLLV